MPIGPIINNENSAQIEVFECDNLTHEIIDSFSTRSTVTHEHFILVKINININRPNELLNKAVIKLQYSVFDDCFAFVNKCDSSRNILSSNSIRMERYSDENANYLLADIGDLLLKDGSSEQYFAITLENSDYLLEIYNQRSPIRKPQIELTFNNLSNEPFVVQKNAKFESFSLGNNTVSIDLHSSIARLNYLLAEYNSPKFDFAVSLLWASERNRNRFFNNFDSGLPNGCKFSFQMFLCFNESNIQLIDQNYKVHYFELVVDASNVYIDSSGSRMIIETFVDSYLLTDSSFNKYVFDLNGLLNEIRIFNNGIYYSIYIEYFPNSAKVSRVFDNDLIDVSFAYDIPGQININFSHYKNEIIIYFSNYLLNQIEEVGFESYQYSFTHILSFGLTEFLIQNIFLNNRKLHFEYDYFRRIINISELNINDEFLNNTKISYGKFETEINVLPNDRESLKTSRILYFDCLGNYVTEKIKNRRGYKFLTFFEFSENCDMSADYSTELDGLSINRLVSNDGLEIVLLPELDPFHQYTLFLEFDFQPTLVELDEEESITVEVYENNNLLVIKTYKIYELTSNNYKFIPFIANLVHRDTNFNFIKVVVTKSNSNDFVYFVHARIDESDKTNVIEKCSSINLGELIDQFPNNENYYNFIEEYEIKFIKNSIQQYSIINPTYDDFIQSHLYSKILNFPILFCEDGKRALFDISSIEIRIDENSFVPLNNVKFAKISRRPVAKKDKYVLSEIFEIEASNFKVRKFNRHIYESDTAISSSESFIDFSGKIVSSTDEEHITNSYTYSNEGLISRIVSSKFGESVVVDYLYNDSGDLINESQYLNGLPCGKTLSFDKHLMETGFDVGIDVAHYFYDENRNFVKVEQNNKYCEIIRNNSNQFVESIHDNHFDTSGDDNVRYCYDDYDRLSEIYIFNERYVSFSTIYDANYIEKRENYNDYFIVNRYDKYNRLIEKTTTNHQITYKYGNNVLSIYNRDYFDKLNKIEYSDIDGVSTINISYDENDRINLVSQGNRIVEYSYGGFNLQTTYITCVKKTYSLGQTNYLEETEDSCLTLVTFKKQVSKNIVTNFSSNNIFHQFNNQISNGYSEIINVGGYKICNEIQRCNGYDVSSSSSINPLISSEHFFDPIGSHDLDLGTINYEYYQNGKIKKIINSIGLPTIFEYFYDNLGRIHSETITVNGVSTNKEYHYDSYGNITMRIVDSNIQRYGYNDRNYLISNSGLRLYTYNNLGYPTSYYFNDIMYEDGLMTQFGDTLFSYDAFRRLRKIESENNNQTIIDYFDDKILEYTKIINGNEYKLNYIYGAKNKLIGFFYNNQFYYIIYNILNDVVAILDSQRNLVARYVYDAFGSFKVYDFNGSEINDLTNIARIFPYRYRSYYYVEETFLYYITSRYYDPSIGRFISPDDVDYLDPTSIGSLNLYAYCNNDPVNYYDPSGHIAISTAIIFGLIGIGAIAGFSAVAYNDYKDDGKIFNGSVDWKTYVGGTILGGAIGGAIGYFAAPGITALITSTGSIGGGLVFAGIGGSIGSGIAISALGEIALVGTSVLTGIGAFGTTMMFAKGGLPNNKYQNRQWAEAMRRLGIENKDLWRRLHNEMQKYPYNTHDDLKKLINLLIEILKKWGIL